MNDLKIEYLPIDSLTPYERNAKEHPQEQIEQIKRSIKDNGMNDPIGIWGKNNTIVEGHGRLIACKELGIDTVPCIRLDHMTDEQRRQYTLIHNQTTMNSGWDVDIVELELADMPNFDAEFYGFDVKEEDQDVEEDDYNPQISEEPKSKYGDLYQLGRHRLLCGDSTILTDVEKLMGDEKADMFLTDPPYNVDYEGTAGKIKNDKMENDKFRLFLSDAFSNAKSVMKSGAAFHIWHADSEGYNFRGACIDAGLQIRQCLIWVKNSLVLGRQDFQWKHEPCLYGENPPAEGTEEEFVDEYNDVALYGWKEGSKHYWFKNRKQTTILNFDRPTASKEHPTMKPIKLFDYQMKCNTKKGENVLDLFAGSGTTIMAAEQNGRNAFCMEFDPKFVDVIIDRWEKFTGEKAVLLNG